MWAQDLLNFAQAVYVADRVSRRAATADRWTRELELAVQVIDAHPWCGRAGRLARDLAAALTGDRWLIEFHGGAQPAPETIPGFPGFSDCIEPEIALFSGGLDSTGYVVERARIAGPPLVLVANDHPGLQLLQRSIVNGIPGQQRVVQLRQFSLQPTGFETTELSNRSRGLLYAATGIYVTAAHAARRLAIPENGFMAINLPLTASRSGSLSTRSTHPWTVYLLNGLIDAVGGDVQVVNPYLDMTKGEVVGRARDHQATPQFLAQTISCGDHSANRSRPSAHCGYCFPCLVRRSAMLAALDSDPTEYTCRLDEASRDPRRGRHLRALRHHLGREITIEDVIGDMPFPDSPTAQSALPCWSAVD
ncbi:MAG: hypothetical protein GEU83_16245 [Pseudonocardiaceae bacterium]|nr:hypothetical protein [Pseudonocardiaceae bacterium]